MAVDDGNDLPHLPERRGIDPTWKELDYDFATILVKASCEDVAEVLKKKKGVDNKVRDLRSRDVYLHSDDWGRAIFVFQLAGHEWTHISGADWWLTSPELAASLSKRLRSLVFQNLGEGVYLRYNTHLLFEFGKQIEDDREADQAALDLGLFIAYDVWGDGDGGRVVCSKGWDWDAFRGAFLLTLKV